MAYHVHQWQVRREWKDEDGRLLRHRTCKGCSLDAVSAVGPAELRPGSRSPARDFMKLRRAAAIALWSILGCGLAGFIALLVVVENLRR
jgi:hypothetical protein